MAEAIKVVHSEVEIVYNEQSNEWDFELRGRCRHAESLQKAKDAIDAPEPKSKKPFKRFKAFRINYGGQVRSVEVTSVAGKNYSGGYELWISSDEGRTKVSSSQLYAVTPENSAKISEIKRLQNEQSKLHEQERSLMASLTGIVELLGDAATESV